jgi:2,3-bisphosphoglycerate-independent phosphoglycerate mutase
MELISRLSQPSDRRAVLFVLDGVGDIRTETQPKTALEAARLPNFDELARRSALGRIVPVAQGVTPGSGPGHLALFGYDPTRPEVDIGRGVLEALGLDLEVRPGDLAVRGNFATADADGRLTDRRAGRIPTSECQRLCRQLQPALAELSDLEVVIVPGEEHRFVLILRGSGLSPEIADTDPQKTGVPPLAPAALSPEAEGTAQLLGDVIGRIESEIAEEPAANRVLLRGVSRLPDLPRFDELYHLRPGAFAGYPLYRGVASACGMEVVPCGKSVEETIGTVEEHWDRFDFFFVHIKQTDKAGEDGDLDAKVKVLERVDAELPRLLKLGPAALAVTGDHSTPAPLKAHSWHPVPLLIHSEFCFVDETTEFTETAAAQGHLGTFRSIDLIGMLLANAGRLAKFGA